MKTSTMRLCAFVLFIFLLSLLTLQAKAWDFNIQEVVKNTKLDLCTTIGNQIPVVEDLKIAASSHKGIICKADPELKNACNEATRYYNNVTFALAKAKLLNTKQCGIPLSLETALASNIQKNESKIQLYIPTLNEDSIQNLLCQESVLRSEKNSILRIRDTFPNIDISSLDQNAKAILFNYCEHINGAKFNISDLGTSLYCFGIDAEARYSCDMFE